jgi:tetratricopeptide (TPR) repeat protein
MIMTDITGLDMTSASPSALAAWDRTTELFLSHDRDTPTSLAETLAADPDCALAWCAKGLFTALLARAELTSPVEQALAHAEASIRIRGATARERSYLEALRCAAKGSFTGAVAALEVVLDSHPRDSVAAKLSHSLRFMLGDASGMRSSIERVVVRAGLNHPHLGYLLGCLAFALEETGAYNEAERLGNRALERAPRDAWGLHAISHVYEMTGRANLGDNLLSSHRHAFEHCNNFRYHVFWHLALFRLELGDLAGALELYDEHIRSDKTDDFRDVANAVSLLTRLEIAGASVGTRWDELAAIAERRISDRSLVFAGLHYTLALVGAGRCDIARQLTAGLGDANSVGDQGRVAQEVGAPTAAALTMFGESRFREAALGLLAVRPKLCRIGGSNAQRDLFEQMLIESCIRAGMTQQATVLLSERLGARGKNRFATDRLEWIYPTQPAGATSFMPASILDAG